MGKISELINGMIQKILESAEWTSASPGFINTLIQVNAIENPDFEDEIKKILTDPTKAEKIKAEVPTKEQIKQKKEIKGVTDKLKVFDKGNVGDIQRFTAEQFGNVQSMAANPSQFIMTTFFKKFAKGAGLISLGLLLFGVVQWIISEMLKPGRFLDRRFRRNIEEEILAFRSREEKQKLNQGFASIIVTSIGGLRGSSGAQVVNTLQMVGQGIQPFNNNFQQSNLTPEGVSSKDKGRTNRPTRFG